MIQTDIIQAIECIAPLSIATSWDQSGMQLASIRKQCHHIAISLDPTLETLEQATELGADFFLTHHPLSMTPRFLTTLDAYSLFVRHAFVHDMPVYAAHTSLDANPLGPVAWLANSLQLTQRTILEPTGEYVLNGQAIPCGIGLAGNLPDELSFEKLRNALLNYMPKDIQASLTHLPTGLLRRIAICPGSGCSLAQAAVDAKADIFITGDVKYHAALEAPIPIIDLGHFILEEIMMQHFAIILEKALPSIQVTVLPARNPLQAL